MRLWERQGEKQRPRRKPRGPQHTEAPGTSTLTPALTPPSSLSPEGWEWLSVPGNQSTVVLQVITKTLKNGVSKVESPGMMISCLPTTSEAMQEKFDFEGLRTSKSCPREEGSAVEWLLNLGWELKASNPSFSF